MKRLAYCVSSHGFGHAARAAAILEALWKRLPDVRIELFTDVPRWFFSDSLQRPGDPPRLGFHPSLAVDPGLVQSDALQEDLAATVQRLRDADPLSPPRVERLAERFAALSCDLVICDIAPVGLLAAARAGRPSVLIENFTWDWIYRAYLDEAPDLAVIAERFAAAFASATHHLQVEPFCRRQSRATALPPVSRPPRRDRASTRQSLGVPAAAKMVMITMGGIEWDYSRLEPLLRASDTWLVVPGGSPRAETRGRLLRLPHRSAFYHPDLIAAADAVVGKLGYSTLAEVYRSGCPFGYIPRPRFPESPVLEAWTRDNLPHLRIAAGDFADGTFLTHLDFLLSLPRRDRPVVGGALIDGAGQIAAAIVEILLASPASIHRATS